MAPGAARHRRRVGARPRQCDDRARLVRPRIHPQLEQRAAAGARRHRPAADRSRPRSRRRCAPPVCLGRARRRGWCPTTPPPAVTTATATSLALEGEYRVATPQGEVVCHPAFELYARLCRALSARSRRSDLLDPARPGRGSRPADLACAPGVLLRLERPRAARQCHADGARDVAALCADRLASTSRAAMCCSRRRRPRRSPARSCLRRKAMAPDLGASPSARSGRRAGATSRPAISTGRSARESPTRCAPCSASAPTCCWRMPTARMGARR